MYRTHTAGELRLQHHGQQVTLAGWAQRVRDLGGLLFVDLRDRYGITQLYIDPKVNQALYEKAKSLGREFVIQATGLVKDRSSKNSQLPTGEIEIEVTQ